MFPLHASAKEQDVCFKIRKVMLQFISEEMGGGRDFRREHYPPFVYIPS